MLLKRRQFLVGTAAVVAAPWTFAKSELPSTTRIIVPFAPGGPLDVMARIFAESLRSTSGRTILVENKPGASTMIAATEVSRSAPDGSVMLWTTGGHTTNAVLVKKLPYDPIAGFTPLTRVYTTDGFAMITRAESPFNNIKEVIDFAKKNPEKLSYASPGVGNTTHVVAAIFANSAGIKMLHVPYKGPSMPDLMSGVIDFIFLAPSAVMPYLQTGKLRALGISGTKRAATLPNVPTFSEFGLKEVNVPAWIGLLAPPKMASNVTSALYTEVSRVFKQPNFIEKMKEYGNEISGMPPQEFANYINSEIQRYKRILPPLGIDMELS